MRVDGQTPGLEMKKQGVAKKEVQDIKKCDRCGCSLIRVKWNGKSDILMCNNANCQKYHQPAKVIVSDSGW